MEMTKRMFDGVNNKFKNCVNAERELIKYVNSTLLETGPQRVKFHKEDNFGAVFSVLNKEEKTFDAYTIDEIRGGYDNIIMVHVTCHDGVEVDVWKRLSDFGPYLTVNNIFPLIQWEVVEEKTAYVVMTFPAYSDWIEHGNPYDICAGVFTDFNKAKECFDRNKRRVLEDLHLSEDANGVFEKWYKQSGNLIAISPDNKIYRVILEEHVLKIKNEEICYDFLTDFNIF